MVEASLPKMCVLCRVAAILLLLWPVGGSRAADVDRDGDVDQDDFAYFQLCLGHDLLPSVPDCRDADLDGNGTVDQYDLPAFQACMTGPDVAVALGCVLPEAADTLLVPPDRSSSVLGTITGYEMDSGCPYADPATCELPTYRPYNRNTPEWWDNLVEELIHSRVHVVMMHGRGCYDAQSGTDGNGDMCPRLLTHLVGAIARCEGAADVLRLGMWDDTGAYQGARNHIEGLPSGTLFNLADPTAWGYFWDHNMRIWFDTVPPDLWYRLDGRPVVAFWGPVWMTNVQGNASRLFDYLRANFIARYGEDPHFNVTSDWLTRDSTLTTQHVQAAESWFDPSRNTYTYKTWNDAVWGCVVPGFRDPDYLPGCGSVCRERLRNDGAALVNGLAAGVSRGARFTLLEGWTDVAESAGYYRSDAWRYPNQYINIVREFADPHTETLRFQAEAADFWLDTTPGNQGYYYRDGDLDIGRLADGTGWYVGWTQPGEWIQFNEVDLTCGTYRFTARVNGGPGQRLHLEVDGGSLGPVQLVRGRAGVWQLVHLGTAQLSAGPHDLRLVWDTGQISVDWFFSRKLARSETDCRCVHLRAEHGQYVVARNGGGGTVRADSLAAGPWERFTLVDHNGPPLVSGDSISLRTYNAANYLTAENGGGGAVTASASQVGLWERFTLIRMSGGGPITGGNTVALQASNGQYMVAELGGGDALNANRSAIGPWEIFTIEMEE